jgi:hypothetical protein
VGNEVVVMATVGNVAMVLSFTTWSRTLNLALIPDVGNSVAVRRSESFKTKLDEWKVLKEFGAAERCNFSVLLIAI